MNTLNLFTDNAFTRGNEIPGTSRTSLHNLLVVFPGKPAAAAKISSQEICCEKHADPWKSWQLSWPGPPLQIRKSLEGLRAGNSPMQVAARCTSVACLLPVVSSSSHAPRSMPSVPADCQLLILQAFQGNGAPPTLVTIPRHVRSISCPFSSLMDLAHGIAIKLGWWCGGPLSRLPVSPAGFTKTH